ncbi:MAG: O-acetyl-ADP-ribose deacetylase (regulator of RNase III)/uncharacterized protein YwgA [Roseivirga sp.]|jgi:O-acetyl-ADP-ribose deacetylase (regulator of RNase III)/uncharacterized protein YwgA
MLEFVKGNLLDAEVDTLVNTVNTVGVMGKGIALQFKNRFPYNYKVYKEACKNGTFTTGQVLVVQDGDLLNQKTIINFPTKAHWKSPSKYEYIISGLEALRITLVKNKIKSIAIPPLGCGNGGLDWNKVKSLITKALKDIDAKILVFTPNEDIKEMLQKENTVEESKLTPARAMLLYLLFHYESVGEQSSLFVANKLAYFLQRSGEKLRLKFEPHLYGPYSVQVNHVLLHLNGTYLKGMEQNQTKAFEPFILNYERFDEIKSYVDKKLSQDQRDRVKSVLSLLKGFESTFSLELLSTIDFISSHEERKEIDSILERIESWSDRKTRLFERSYVEIAHKHLVDHSQGAFQLS